MNIKEKKIKSQYILFDQEVIDDVGDDYFSPLALARQDAITAEAQGRGTTWFYTIKEKNLVLKHYLRGGVIAKLSNDQYIWNGLTKTRAWQEFHLLAKLQQLKLPAPQPFAAQVHHKGLSYSADIITFEIKHSKSLSDILIQQPIENSLWEAIGKCIHTFHQHGVYHADLNASNILIRDKDIFLIDFDKGKILDIKQSWQAENINRLKRSLLKLQSIHTTFHFNDDNWQAFQTGYQK